VSDRYDIWCDGACEGNGKPDGIGGWAYIRRDGTGSHSACGAISPASNNIAELTAAIEALKTVPPKSVVTVYTDSKYVRDGMTSWLPSWKRKGWLTKQHQPVKNRPLWEQLDALCTTRQVIWKWIPGHAGHEFNEQCDALAVTAIYNYKFASKRIEIPVTAEIGT